MAYAFQIFSLVHSVMTTPQRLYRVVEEILEDFESQNCGYLELRTTPKENLYMTKEIYMSTIEKAISEYKGSIIVRIIVSVNRGLTLEDAEKNLEIAKNCKVCVGLDFSGNPNQGKFRDFIEVFEKAREFGLKITVHTAEVQDDQDTDDILRFKPDRLGHCCFLSAEAEEFVLKHRIPIEMCPSSNMAVMNLQTLAEHHFARFHEKNHPIALCTDDTLLFDTDLSKEFKIVSDFFGLGYQECLNISKNSGLMAFDELAIKFLEKYEE